MVGRKLDQTPPSCALRLLCFTLCCPGSLLFALCSPLSAFRFPLSALVVNAVQLLGHRGHGRADLIFGVGAGNKEPQASRTLFHGWVEDGLYIDAATM